jgi:DNA-binding MarR family transcriptional regulator
MKTDPPDTVDAVIDGWRTSRPDLDASPLELVGRVIVLAGHLERGVDAALKPHGLVLGQFDILATLRREGAGMTPSQLLQRVVLTSGGMTNRLDRLEASGWIARRADPADRRAVVVELTAAGKKVIDAATATRLTQAADALPLLTPTESHQLTRLLRRWLVTLEDRADTGR